MPNHARSLAFGSLVTGLLIGTSFASHLESRSIYNAPQAAAAMRVDGIADEAAWDLAEWRDIKYKWLGPDYTPDDFAGRFKIVWTPERIYLLAEIVDDILIDSHRDPLVQYWDDDCLEIFIDEDFSGGEHHYNHNAFAYHFSLDNQAIDIGTDEKARSYSHHTQSTWRQHGDKIIWEVSIDIYDDSYVDDGDNDPVALACEIDEFTANLAACAAIHRALPCQTARHRCSPCPWRRSAPTPSQ